MDGLTRALVIGAGSIGTRHARILAELGLDVAVVSARTDLDPPAHPTVAAALAAHDPGYVVIATETARHTTAVRELAGAGFGGTVLIEKPLAVTAGDLAEVPFRALRVGYNLRFHPVTLRLAELLAEAEVVAVDAYAGQHLSTWRPGRDLAAQYSARAGEGGGVLRDLSHELDYLGLLFGHWTRVVALGGRLADVTVDSDDAWGMLAAFERAPIVTLQLNYLAQPPRRRLVVTTPTGLVEADFIAGEITHDGRVESLPSDRDETYRRMHAAMLVGGLGATDAAEALEVERLIAAVERSAAESRWVDA